jgi:hypothetical protein
MPSPRRFADRDRTALKEVRFTHNEIIEHYFTIPASALQHSSDSRIEGAAPWTATKGKAFEISERNAS